jgi:SAM-dependent methyltransferase
MAAAEVARRCGCNPLGTKYLLDYLTSLQLLQEQMGEYALTTTAATFLIPQQKSYVGDLILAFTGPEMWDSMLHTLRSGEQATLLTEQMHAQDAWLESYSTERVASSREMWRTADIEPDLPLHILDIASGCAIKSLSLAQLGSTIQVTCLDTLVVLEVARDLAGRMGILSRVTFWPENLLSVQLGEGVYEVCLLGQITHFLNEQQNRDLFQRIYTVLLPGGTLVLDVPMSTEPLEEGSSFLSLIFWAIGGGAAHSYEVYRSWLEETGFGEVKQLGKHWLSAIK